MKYKNIYTLPDSKYSKLKLILLSLSLLSLFCNLKFVIFVACSLLLFSFNSKSYTAFLKDIIPASIFVISMALISIILGNDSRYVILESRDVAIFFLVFALLKTISRFIFAKNEVVRVLINLFLCLAIIKVLILVYCFIKGIPATEIVRGIRELTGWGLQTYGVSDTFLARIQFPIDLASCFIIIFQMQYLKNNRSFFNWIILLLLFFSILMSMSRIFWFICIVNVFSFLFLINKGKLKLKYMLILLGFVILLSFLFYDSIMNIIQSRLSTSNNYYSDLERTIQDLKLKEKIQSAFLFGHGIGYYIPDYLRSYVDGYKYAYESQILATIMKIGIIGFFFFLICVIFICFNGYSSASIPLRLFLMRCVMLVLWLLSGYYNPLLFNVPAGMILYLTTQVNSSNFPTRDNHS
ncbi:O-antigen ligase family protein [Pluralibacter gergoviae]|uniref:O-antigen ligase family protein n=1 Tax=Pluralibacter gergoviae TaxID=61647 RepID=UPI002FD93196